MQNVCIIPARGGSKRIPNKNIKLFHGKPMIAYSIAAAKASGCFDRILVSTDSDEISWVSRQWGAETPFVRPDKISDDFSLTVDVVKHGIEWLEKNGDRLVNICCIYATAPFLEPEDIRRGFNSIQDPKVTYAFSATSFGFPIQRAFFLDEAGRVRMFSPEHANTRSQDLIDAYHDAGQFYWGKVSSFKSRLPFFGSESLPVLIPRNRVQDIDTLEDWDVAENMYAALRK